MKKIFTHIVSLMSILLILSSCEDKIIETYTANVPVYITHDELRTSIKQENSRSLENPGKIYFYNNYLFVNEYLKGIHIIDNTNPLLPQNTGFINIPGNVDIAIKNDILYADSYIDLVAIDISDLNNISEVNRLKEIFPYILPPLRDENYRVDEVDYSKGIVIDWELKEVTREVEEQNYRIYPWYSGVDYMALSYGNGTGGYSSGASSFGVGGSMARFTAFEDILYTIDSYSLKIIDIKTPDDINLVKTISVGWNAETLFPSGNNLFIGSQQGMIIYDISNPYNPTFVSDYWHITSCDPVVVEGDYAYVTLRSGNWCGETTDQLDVIDISNLTEPNLVRSYAMTEPYGLGIDNSTLFICDGSAGLKIYNTTDVMNIDENIIATFSNINTYDVIPLNGVLMLIGNDGLHQYDYTNLENIEILSTIEIAN